MVSTILFLKLFEELLVRDIDTLGSFSEIGESVVLLSLGVDDLITSHLNKICLVLPLLISWLLLAIAFEETWSILLDIVIEEAFRCHSFVVTFWDLLVERQVLQD